MNFNCSIRNQLCVKTSAIDIKVVSSLAAVSGLQGPHTTGEFTIISILENLGFTQRNTNSPGGEIKTNHVQCLNVTQHWQANVGLILWFSRPHHRNVKKLSHLSYLQTHIYGRTATLFCHANVRYQLVVSMEYSQSFTWILPLQVVGMNSQQELPFLQEKDLPLHDQVLSHAKSHEIETSKNKWIHFVCSTYIKRGMRIW